MIIEQKVQGNSVSSGEFTMALEEDDMQTKRHARRNSGCQKKIFSGENRV